MAKPVNSPPSGPNAAPQATAASPKAPSPAAPRAAGAPAADAARPKTSGLSALGGSSLSTPARAGASKEAAPPAKPAAASSSPVSRKTIQLVQESWAKVMPISDAAAALFYDRLFEQDPSVRPLFKSDISEQKKKLMQTLAVAVDGLNNIDRLVPVLQSLGARHAGYMVEDRHYDLVGEALLWTLREGLGDEFSDDVETAWTEVYTLIAGVMKKAAAEHQVVPSGVPSGSRTQDNVPLPLVTSARRDGAATAQSRDVKPRPAAAAAAPPPKADAGRSREAAQDGHPSARTISLVQASWAKVMPISDAAATLFYERLFEMDPSVRALFKSDMREQKKKLMQTLTVAVDGLNNLDRLVPVLKDLGVRHAGYMVADHHYDLVGAALLWTLREGLGDEFTDEVEAGWKEIYTLVAGVMKSAAAEHTGAAPRGAPAPQARSAAPAPQARSAAAPAPQAQAAAPPPVQVPPAQPSRPGEDDVDTMHYDSSRRPPIVSDPLPLAKAAPRSPEFVEPAALLAAAAPAHREPAPAAQTAVVPLLGNEVTLNVRLAMDAPLPTAPREAPARADDAGSPGGLFPALFLAALCAIASMGLALAAPGMGVQSFPRFAELAPLAVPVFVLALVLAAFGLGYLFGRGRKPSGSGDLQ
jgi:hemoglobin-like flavoprotein